MQISFLKASKVCISRSVVFFRYSTVGVSHYSFYITSAHIHSFICCVDYFVFNLPQLSQPRYQHVLVQSIKTRSPWNKFPSMQRLEINHKHGASKVKWSLRYSYSKKFNSAVAIGLHVSGCSLWWCKVSGGGKPPVEIFSCGRFQATCTGYSCLRSPAAFGEAQVPRGSLTGVEASSFTQGYWSWTCMEATVCQPCLMFRVAPATATGVAGVFFPGLFAVVELHSTVFGESPEVKAERWTAALRIRDPAHDEDSLAAVQCPVYLTYSCEQSL